MNGGLFHKIKYKCEPLYQQKKKEYQTAIDRYKHEITNLRRLKTIYSNQLKYIQRQKNIGNKNGSMIVLKRGTLIRKTISLGHCDLHRCFGDASRAKTSMQVTVPFTNAGIGGHGKLQFFGTEEQECSPRYIETLIQLENRFTALKAEYNKLYDEVVGLKSQLDKLVPGNIQQKQFNQPRNNFNPQRQIQDNVYTNDFNDNNIRQIEN